MIIRRQLLATAALATALVVACGIAHGDTMQVTEWMYNGSEFMEFTNMAATSVDLTGWSYSDSARSPGAVSLSSFGTVASGESVIVAEATAAAFRTTWNLAGSVKVLGGNAVNLGRSDEINIYNATNTLIDRLTYTDQAGKGPRTDVKSCTIPLDGLALNDASGTWAVAAVGDAFGSWTAASGGWIGNPGRYYAAPAVPEPGSILALASGLAGFLGLARRRQV